MINRINKALSEALLKIDKRMIVLCKNIPLHPNYLTILRIFLIPAIIWLYQNECPIGTLIVFLVAWLLDLFDGPIARAHGFESQLGALLDPLADKLLFICPLIFLFYGQIWQFISIPLILIETGLIIIRAIKMVYNYTNKLPRPDIKANNFGKIKSNLEQTSIFLMLTSYSAGWFVAIINIILGFALAMALLSICKQVRR